VLTVKLCQRHTIGVDRIKPIKPKICPICQTEFKPWSTTQRVDSTYCAIQFNKLKDEAKAKKKHIARKKVFYANDLKTRKQAAKKACHDYIRVRDKGLPCICCNRPLTSINAGHYLESGNNPQIRYDEDNIHNQSIYCNQYQGGDSDDYRGNLIKKIGLERVERLEGMKGGTMKRTCEDYKKIEQYFKQKLKQLTNHKG